VEPMQLTSPPVPPPLPLSKRHVLSSLGPPPGQHLAARRRAVPLQKTVCPLARLRVGLKRPLHQPRGPVQQSHAHITHHPATNLRSHRHRCHGRQPCHACRRGTEQPRPRRWQADLNRAGRSVRAWDRDRRKAVRARCGGARSRESQRHAEVAPLTVWGPEHTPRVAPAVAGAWMTDAVRRQRGGKPTCPGC